MSKKLKTLNDLKEEDNELSGCLTPANGEEYNYALGEPFYHTSYKVNYVQLMQVAREWVKELEKPPASYHMKEVEWIKQFFNLEDE